MIIILGPPGGGKGTQAKILSQQMNRPYFPAGDTLKEYIKHRPELHRIVQNGGLLESDEINTYLLKTALALGNGVIFDGFPRTLKQCEFLCNNVDLSLIEAVIILNVSKEEIEKRISNRFICNTCKTSYRVKSYCCDNYSTKREDDLLHEAVQNRWDGFKKNIHYLITIFIEHNIKILTLNGEADKDTVTGHILEKMGVVINGQ